MTSWIPGTRTPASPPPPSWRGFTTAWERGLQEVYTVWLPRGRHPVGEVAIRHWQTWVRWVGPSYGPAVVSILLLDASGAASFHADHAWLLLLIGTINGGMFAAAVLSWKFALLKADTLDELLEPCSNRDSLVAMVAKAVRHWWQAPPSIIAAAILWMGYAASDSRWLATFTGFVVLLNCTWTLMLLVNVSYWLAVPPVLVIRLRSSREYVEVEDVDAGDVQAVVDCESTGDIADAAAGVQNLRATRQVELGGEAVFHLSHRGAKRPAGLSRFVVSSSAATAG